MEWLKPLKERQAVRRAKRKANQNAGRSGRTMRDSSAIDDIDELIDMIEAIQNDIRYWSFCAYRGMQEIAPEDRQRFLADFGGTLDISPYNEVLKKETCNG